MTSFSRQVKFTSAVKLSEGSATEYGREEEENFFKRLGKWRSGRRNPSKLHHTEEKDGRTLGISPLPVCSSATCSVFVPVRVLSCASGALTVLYHLPCQLCVCVCISLWISEESCLAMQRQWFVHGLILSTRATSSSPEFPKCKLLDVYTMTSNRSFNLP